ncbi:MAG: hypothetical protein EBZ48_17870 [Proteobacteria bacterium]|nr:hypothetical protein [Pseudomonadota bacterium]
MLDMLQHAKETQLSDLIAEIELIDGVCFDPNTLTLHGLYSDELSAHRARRGWLDTLENSFFLELEEDFAVEVQGDLGRGRYVLSCEFRSASARYAFWRLTHQQAPEAQYMIETAHVPSGSFSRELAQAPDLTPLIDDLESFAEKDLFETGLQERTLMQRLSDALTTLVKPRK